MKVDSPTNYRSSEKAYLRTVPNFLNVHYVNHLKSEKSDILVLHTCILVTTYLTTNNKRNPGGNRKESDTQDNTIIFPAFDLSTKRVGFGNDNTRVTKFVYEIRYHPTHTTLLK